MESVHLKIHVRVMHLLPRSLSVIAFALAGLALTAYSILARDSQAATPEKRFALVVGNGNYQNGVLRNPVNDARAMAKVLRENGFQVMLKEDLTYKGFIETLRQFSQELDKGSVGMFYYAGHGIQLRDRNYLIPVDASMESEDEVQYMAIDAMQVLDKMERARTRVNVVILDACRDNPFARSFRSETKGLARMDAPSGTLIAFATSPGSVASDGHGENGVYTKHLLKQLATPGVQLEIALKRVRESVSQETKGKQIPWESSSLMGDFYVADAGQKPASVAAEKSTTVAAEKSTTVAAIERQKSPASAPNNVDVEIRFWDSVKDSSNRADYEAYLAQYPNGKFAKLALARLDRLKTTPQPEKTAMRSPEYTRVPRLGDSWTYMLTATGQREIGVVTIEVTDASPDKVKERITLSSSKKFQMEREVKVGFNEDEFQDTVVFPGNFQLAEISPYVPADQPLREGLEWKSIVSEFNLSIGGKQKLAAQMKVIGREKIRVPAGEFDAWKIEVLSSKTSGNFVQFKAHYWYVPELMRTPRIQITTLLLGARGAQETFELMSFKRGN